MKSQNSLKKRSVNRRALSLSPIAFAALAACSTVWAQSETGQLEEVTVTARKVSEKLQEVPVTVTAFTSEKLKELGIKEVKDVGASTPGLFMTSGASSETSLQVSQRGQYQNDSLATLESSVGIYVDDMYWARAYGLNSNILDAKDVQVLKGPQGTLFGRNTTGGAVVISTNDPVPGKLAGSIEGGIGNYNLVTGTGILNVPIKDDVVALRVALTSTQRDGWATDTITGAKYSNQNDVAGRVKLGIYPNDTTSIILSVDTSEQKIDGPAWFATAKGGLAALVNPGLGAYVNSVLASNGSSGALSSGPASLAALGGGKPGGVSKTDTNSIRVSTETALGNLKLTIGNRTVKNNWDRELDGAPSNFFTSTVDGKTTQDTFEAQLSGKTMGKKLDYVVGATYSEEKGTDGTHTTLAVVPWITRYLGTINNKSSGLYGQTTYHFDDKLGLTTGLRYSDDIKSTTMQNGRVSSTGAYTFCSPITGASIANNCSAGNTAEFNNTSYTIGLDYKLDEKRMAFGKYSTGYRSGGQNLRATNDNENSNFKPELISEYEFGFKGDLLNGTLRLNASYFVNELKDAQRTVILLANNTNNTLVGNAATVTNQGLEIDAKAILSKSTSLSFSVATQDPKYSNFTFQGVDHSNDRFQGIAKLQASLGLDYATDIELGKLKFNASYNWRDKVDMTNTQGVDGAAAMGLTQQQFLDATTAPAGGVLNARISLQRDKKLEYTAWATNLLNDHSLVNALYVTGVSITGQFRAPTMFGVTASYKF